MGDDFFEASGGGDSAAFQHIMWVLGRPDTWLTLLLWLALLIALIKIAKRLWRKRRKLWLVLFLIIVSAALTYYVWLSKNAYSFYVEGRGHEIIALRYAKLAVLILSILSMGWIIVDWFKSRQSN